MTKHKRYDDAHKPKKWEPRGGAYYLNEENAFTGGASSEACRLAGREYPTRGVAERAAPMHRKLDRLVNWLVEHHEEFDGEFSLSSNPTGSLCITFWSIAGKCLIDAILSGEVEL